MGASKKAQMGHLADDWANQVLQAAVAMNGGKGAAWLPALCICALTGCRPVALELGIRLVTGEVKGMKLVQITVPGTKHNDEGTRGQDKTMLFLESGISHRPKELAILERLMAENGGTLTVKYDAEAISTRLRETSKKLWPRRKYHVTAYCYRELFASSCKESGMKREDIALAMGHQSIESQGAYARTGRGKRGGGGVAPVKKATGTIAVRSPKAARNTMTGFKIASKAKRTAAGIPSKAP